MLKEETDIQIDAYDWPEVTVAVCVLNGEQTIRACLDSLMKLDYPREKLSILIVDNGSADKTREIVAEYAVELIFEETKGRGFARNRAWKFCKTPFIAFTDADCTVSEDWLKTVMPAFDEQGCAIAGSDIVTPGEEPLARFFELRQIVSNKEFSGNYKFSPAFLATANAVFLIDAIKAVDGFRTTYVVAEDADICWRIVKKGYRLIYIEGGIVYHNHRMTKTAMFRQSRDYGYGGVAVYLVHYPDTKLWIWWGLYYRILASAAKAVTSFTSKDPFMKILPRLDLLRYSGLALGRISAAWKFKRIIL